MLSNAFKFTLKGGVDVKLLPEGDSLILTVSDTGIGISPEELPRIFERFHRVEGAEGRTHEGSGIGLAFVQELVKLLGGAVSVESQLGRGTTFRVSIPRGDVHLSVAQSAHVENVKASEVSVSPFIEEALRWLPDTYEAENCPSSRMPHMSRPDKAQTAN
ncbi:hypothetical protein LAC81_37765 (plasmid) [Ensifer adhaerens]|nr:hypothetical protein LAC78_39065 [Ensifer adhaerens]UAY05463.1 hypothetical protein LAC80_37780 [Ensifer adhaerens]UAY12841.1 hypothetical protein LAC81_37765 [Ensifer adhaerens]